MGRLHRPFCLEYFVCCPWGDPVPALPVGQLQVPVKRILFFVPFFLLAPVGDILVKASVFKHSVSDVWPHQSHIRIKAWERSLIRKSAFAPENCTYYLKAVKQIGLTISPNVLARADKVIR